MSITTSSAAAVLRYLVETFPIDPDRLLSVGFGQSRLRSPADAHAAINRRVEVLLIAER